MKFINARVACVGVALLPFLATATEVTTNLPDFLAHLDAGYFDSGVGFGINNGATMSESFSGGTPTFSYVVSAPYNGIFSDGASITSGFSTDPLVFTFSTSPNPVTAVGGYFGITDTEGAFIPGTLQLLLSDSTTVSLDTTALAGSQGFVGFIVPNDTFISSLTLTPDHPLQFAGATQLFVGVPETSTYAAAGFMSLCIGGLWLKRSRRAA